MSYFSRFPFVTRKYGSDKIVGVNLTRRTGILSKYKTDPKYFLVYNIQDGETPEILADRLYDEASYSWIVLMFNDIINVFEQWPLDYQSLMTYIKEKYEDPYAVHHYESISTSLVVDSDYLEYDKLIVTNVEHEIAVNDAKRKIKLLIPDYVSAVVTQHNNIVSGG